MEVISAWIPERKDAQVRWYRCTGEMNLQARERQRWTLCARSGVISCLSFVLNNWALVSYVSMSKQRFIVCVCYWGSYTHSFVNCPSFSKF